MPGDYYPIIGKLLSKNNSTCENAVSQAQYGRRKLRVMAPGYAKYVYLLEIGYVARYNPI